MSATHAIASSASLTSKSAGKGNAPVGDNDWSGFSLRDTLSGITVRDANFGEFLAALKSFGMQPTTKQ